MSDEQLTQLTDRLDDLDVHFLSSGKAFVMNVSNGHSHEVTLTSCDCADFEKRNGGTYDGLCKHIVARRLTEACPICGDVMHYETQILEQFVCEGCGYARMSEIVRQDRKERIAA